MNPPAPATVGRVASGAPPQSAPCLLCGSGRLRTILEQPGVPALCNVLWPTATAARQAPRGDVLLTFCAGCGAVHNEAFDPDLVRYTPEYENSLHFSPRFSSYADELARRLVASYGLHGGTALEIGSGKGDFLALLSRHGIASAIGYDPSLAEPPRDAPPGVTFVLDRFPERPGSVSADLICCRHVLEHLGSPADLLLPLRRAIGEDSDPVLYFEVPDGAYLLGELAVWDVIYEHPWHLTSPALRRLFVSAGFAVLATGTSFAGQYLFAEAAPARGPQAQSDDDEELSTLGRLADGFADGYVSARSRWCRTLRSYRDAGLRVALWGAGSKGTTFLNVVPGADEVGCVVDLNPRKHGRHVPGTGQKVVGPVELRSYAPDVVLVMNPLYVDEIQAQCRELGVTGDVVVVHGNVA